jgi:hypothetical protein
MMDKYNIIYYNSDVFVAEMYNCKMKWFSVLAELS